MYGPASTGRSREVCVMALNLSLSPCAMIRLIVATLVSIVLTPNPALSMAVSSF